MSNASAKSSGSKTNRSGKATSTWKTRLVQGTRHLQSHRVVFVIQNLKGKSADIPYSPSYLLRNHSAVRSSPRSRVIGALHPRHLLVFSLSKTRDEQETRNCRTLPQQSARQMQDRFRTAHDSR